MNDITLEQALDIIQSGKFCSVEFIKRTTSQPRKMLARSGVHKFLKGGKPAYDFLDKGLVSVFDIQKMAYRCIPIEQLYRVNGKEIKK